MDLAYFRPGNAFYPAEKKLIHTGYTGTTEFIRKNSEIENIPFDALIISLFWNSNAFIHDTKRRFDRYKKEQTIPWAAIGGTPKIGESRKAQIGRSRSPGIREISSWSPMWESYAETKYAGTFVFKRALKAKQ